MPRIRPIFQNGRYSAALQYPTPHQEPRPERREGGWCYAALAPRLPWLVVLHYISLPAGEFGGDAVDALFAGELVETKDERLKALRGLRVSAHFFVRRNGQVHQYVDPAMRAWHAGVSSFEGYENCNDFSVGIELEGTGERAFARAQYRALSQLLAALAKTYPIEAITGHEFIAPSRKQDPGPFFDWSLVRAWARRLGDIRVVTTPQHLARAAAHES